MGPVTDFKGLTVRTAILILLASSLGMAVSAQENAPVFQAFFGSLQLDDQTADWDDISDAEVDVGVDDSRGSNSSTPMAERHCAGASTPVAASPGKTMAHAFPVVSAETPAG